MLPCSLRYSADTNYTKNFPVLISDRHSYLLRDISCIVDFNPRLASRVVDKLMSFHTTYRNLDPPLLKLSSSHPTIFSPYVDSTREKIAFGRWGLPKLMKKLHNDNVIVIMQALNSISDLVYDPERAYHAVNIGLIDRLEDLMLHEKDFIREKICLILCTLSGVETGRRAVLRRYNILKNLALLLEDPLETVRAKTQMILDILCLSPAAAEALNHADFLVLLLRLIGGTPNTKTEDIIILHLNTLKKLLDRDFKEIALKHNVINILIEKIKHENDKIKCSAMECMGILCQIAPAREEADEKKVVCLLIKALKSDSMEVRVKATGALAFLTIQPDIRKFLCKKEIVDGLMSILDNFHNSEGQLVATKVLSNLFEHSEGRNLVKKLRKKVEKVVPCNEDAKRHIDLLLSKLKKKKYSKNKYNNVK